MPTPDITTLTADLRVLGGQRVWSLMISLFGDLAQGEHDGIDGPVLSTIMAALEVKPEAARVALHRLRNDGWITSAKTGRISSHSLTPKGRALSAAASPRIYTRPDEGPQDWQLVLLENTDLEAQTSLIAAGFKQITPRVFVGPTTPPLPKGALAMPGQPAPAWLQDQVGPRELAKDYANLHITLTTLAGALPDPQMLNALDTAVLRCLIVHNWRRLVLKHPLPPRRLISDTAGFHLCHLIVADLLVRFARPALATIAQEQATL